MREFTRVVWDSDAARTVWAPRVAAIQTAWAAAEVRTVAEGVRPAALVFDSPGLAEQLHDEHLRRVTLAPSRFVIARATETATAFVDAWRRRDDCTVGQLLGFPDCCIAFFDQVWNLEQRRDPTLAMAHRHPTPLGSNILGRWLGVRLVPHLPCAFGCPATEAHAGLFRAFLPRDCAEWAQEILAWPVQYSALHGIAEIVFPVVKTITNTDYTAQRRVIRLAGTSYPDEAPSGLSFPFVRPSFVPLTSLAPFRTSVQAAAAIQPSRPPTPPSPQEIGETGDWFWRENGFASLPAMREAHDHVLAMLSVSPPRGPVLDLGCGNGLLLTRIGAQFDVPVAGLECDARKHRLAAEITIGDLADWSGTTVDTILISRNRFDERPTLEARVMASARQVLVYSYDDRDASELRLHPQL